MTRQQLATALLLIGLYSSCTTGSSDASSDRITLLDTTKAVEMARSIEATVTPVLAEGLTLSLWGVDSLVADPVAISIDDQGRIYYTRTNRQKNTEFDIRAHQDWEIPSIRLSTIEDKRAFLRQTLSPENSDKNKWLADLNGDSSHDWRDMTIEKEQVFRIEDRNGDGVADKSQLVVEDFHDEVTDAAGGILKQGEDLFVGIGPDLWRIKENKKGVMASKKSISHGYGIHIGFGGHGMSGIEPGPDGRIYWQIGDIGFHGKGPDGKTYNHSNSGVIVRSNPDGSDFEVFAYGNRNTHEFVFDEYGNLISEDNDGDHPGESERLVYVVDGADIGWRTNWQFGKYRDPDNNRYKVWMDEKMYLPRWEGQAAYILPTIRNFVNGPTGMLYNPGTALGPEYKNHFFVAEFVGNPARSGIHAFTLKPKGASFAFDTSRRILGGILATGMDFGPDGALYMGDWIDGWDTKNYGRIWKLDVTKKDSKLRQTTEKHIRANAKTYSIAELSELLRYPDMRVRQKAQFELVARRSEGLAVFKATLASTSHQLARVHAIWGISQLARKNNEHAALLVPYLRDADPEIRAQAARWIGDVRYKNAGAALIPLLKDSYPRAQFFAAEALGRIGHVPAIQPIINMLAANNESDHYLRHAGSLALARIGQPEPVIALAKHPSHAVRIAAVVALRRLRHPGIRAFLTDADAFVVTEAARAINDDESITDALPDLANALKDRRLTEEAFVRRAINANLRLGGDLQMQQLIDYLKDENRPIAMRNEAIDALSTWAKPSVLDRVDGRFRGEITRPLAPVQQRSSTTLISLLSNPQTDIRLHVARALGKLKIEQSASALQNTLQKDTASRVRKEALRALSALTSAKLDEAIRVALDDKEKEVRVTALDLLRTSALPQPFIVSLLQEVISSKPMEEKQAALTTLGSLSATHTAPVFTSLLNQLEARKLPVELIFELSDALDSSGSADLKKRFATLQAAAGKDSLKAIYAGALMGGDAAKGSRIFWSNSSAQCVRCHAIDDYGGNVGPKLNGIATRLSREQLLEALIDPSARIAPGYGLVTLELNDKRKLNGILQEEKPQGYVMKIGDRPDTLVRKADVRVRTNAPSSMPPMHLLLNKKEIRDVVAFLASLKE